MNARLKAKQKRRDPTLWIPARAATALVEVVEVNTLPPAARGSGRHDGARGFAPVVATLMIGERL